MTAKTSSDKAQMTATKAVGLMVGLMVFGVIAAVLLPAAVDQLENDTTDVFTQDNNTATEINARLNSTVTDVETAGATHNVTVQLNDSRVAGTTSNTIDNGSTTDYSMYDGQTVTVGIEDADTSTTPDSATVNYSYAPEYSYNDGARSVWNVLGLAIILAAFLFVVGIGINVYSRQVG